MKAIQNLLHESDKRIAFGAVSLLSLVLLAGATSVAAEKSKGGDNQRDQSTMTTGSGGRYQTTVERTTEGTLSAQDLHQVSLLTSRVVNHLNEAVQGLLDHNPDGAKPQIEKAQKLTSIVRELLPVTTVTTVVKNAAGKEVYRDVDKIQEDRIALYEGMTAVEVVEPIIDAKETEAAIKGLRLADAEIINTSVLADLGYIERKLNRAAALLDEPAEALLQLTLAQTHGVETVVNEIDNPLVEVQHALRLAERMVQEGKTEAAQDNLRLAQVKLGTYRALLGKEAPKAVKALEDDITALMPKAGEKGAAETIREFWERAVSWFQQETGQAHVVTESVADTPKVVAKTKK